MSSKENFEKSPTKPKLYDNDYVFSFQQPNGVTNKFKLTDNGNVRQEDEFNPDFLNKNWGLPENKK